MCAQVITPGYRIVLEAEEGVLRLRARGDQTGEAESEIEAELEGAPQVIALSTALLADILDAVDARHGPAIQHRIVALRSLFRALKQEKVIFRDPTSGITMRTMQRLGQNMAWTLKKLNA